MSDTRSPVRRRPRPERDIPSPDFSDSHRSGYCLGVTTVALRQAEYECDLHLRPDTSRYRVHQVTRMAFAILNRWTISHSINQMRASLMELVARSLLGIRSTTPLTDPQREAVVKLAGDILQQLGEEVKPYAG